MDLKRLKCLPYRTRIDRNDDMVYNFCFITSKDQTKHHITEITIDELNDDLIVKTSCECPSAIYRYDKECKHVKEAKKLLKEHNINSREENEII